LFGPQFLVSSVRGRGRWDDPPEPPGSAQPSQQLLRYIVMWLFMATVIVLFLGLLVAFLFIRSWHPNWPGPGGPTFTPGLAVSTLLMLAAGGLIEAAARLYRRGASGSWPVGCLAGAAGLGVLFLLCQAHNWADYLGRDGLTLNWQVAGFVYLFTAVHALHVVGGVGPLALVARNAARGRYSRADHVGVRMCAMYWHLLDGVWLVMLAAMFAPLPAHSVG